MSGWAHSEQSRKTTAWAPDLLRSPTSMPTADPSSFLMLLELHVEQVAPH